MLIEHPREVWIENVYASAIGLRAMNHIQMVMDQATMPATWELPEVIGGKRPLDKR